MQDSKKTILEAFDPQWLALRYKYDAEARNTLLEANCLQYFEQLSHLRLVDVGAGTGSNCFYLLQKFSQHQHWYLIDHNPVLLQAAKAQFLQRIATHNFQLIQEKENYLSWKEVDKQITVEFKKGILQHINKLIPIENIDLICANAVFDLFTLTEFEEFAQAIFKHNIPFYTTINYAQMSFSQNTNEDSLFVDYYEKHMQRQMPQGKPMGKTVIKNLQQLFSEKGYKVTLGKSNWQLTPNSDLMFQYLLGFMKSSIPEMLPIAKQVIFTKWLALKKEQVKRKTLSGSVEHFDLLAIKI